MKVLERMNRGRTMGWKDGRSENVQTLSRPFPHTSRIILGYAALRLPFLVATTRLLVFRKYARLDTVNCLHLWNTYGHPILTHLEPESLVVEEDIVGFTCPRL